MFALNIRMARMVGLTWLRKQSMRWGGKASKREKLEHNRIQIRFYGLMWLQGLRLFVLRDLLV
jgi:hypothetical protein